MDFEFLVGQGFHMHSKKAFCHVNVDLSLFRNNQVAPLKNLKMGKVQQGVMLLVQFICMFLISSPDQ